MQECVSEFICFITSEASDRCQQEKRKTVNGEDILWAMQSLGFENYCEPLKLYLNKYREVSRKEKRKGEEGGEEERGGRGKRERWRRWVAFIFRLLCFFLLLWIRVMMVDFQFKFDGGGDFQG